MTRCEGEVWERGRGRGATGFRGATGRPQVVSALLQPHLLLIHAVPSLPTPPPHLQVTNGKPHPDVFLAAAAGLGVPAAQCLVLEDAPSGAAGATSAGMRVVVVPSLVGVGAEFGPADPAAASGLLQLLPSLLAFCPESYGLPRFHDTLPPAGHPGGGVIPMDRVVRLRGEVVKGFGRGSKVGGCVCMGVSSGHVRRHDGATHAPRRQGVQCQVHQWGVPYARDPVPPLTYS